MLWEKKGSSPEDLVKEVWDREKEQWGQILGSQNLGTWAREGKEQYVEREAEN